MLGSYRLLILIKLILFELLGLMCIEDDSFRRYRRQRSPSDSNNPSGTPFVIVVSVSVQDYFAVLNCSTPERVPHLKLDWYFQTRASLRPPRVIWQRGHSNIHRYSAYSPDQKQHILQIKPVNYNDSGTYMCVDQTTGFYDKIELIVRDSRSCAGSIIRLQTTMLVCLVLLSLYLSRRTASESQVT
ncbi:unnamed protein product [Adineta steineri]|uniref:Ig-like domain-containing protein n=1 Tax=Adineta steineri TaxID=433720 RepID=A0A815GQ75_9BILA|nr:unnamed protein product [Adineta steineri]CAF0894747.1 unnamed protein product [Adineta steineri]CAF0938501.1 unnamed protein product [Adineta steineri]CAF0964240.1 unnamed protein product [Adineta steineri]CAF1343113.1 unnamed protein product [Adineta steineri]